MDTQSHESGAEVDNPTLVIANAVPIDPKLVELIEQRAKKLSRELENLTINLQARMAQVCFTFSPTTPTLYYLNHTFLTNPSTQN